tara:strand:+ start:100 stop:360 length:261 start_codon:yes stop_codon:yes gene_type:complete
MTYTWYDFLGNIGVILILLSYLLLQINKIKSQSIYYSLMNAIGAFLILVSLYYNFNLSAFIMEFFWLLISLYGLWQLRSVKTQASK